LSGRSPDALLTAARDGDRAALGRQLTLVERGDAPAVPADDASYTVGITGAPGAGKSTLTAALIGHLRAAGTPVAVLAIDPSSPFTGGAILGDRVRMQHHSTDSGVYIRSMATRGHLGGLSLAAPAALRVLGAAGYPIVLVETVGVGQVEVEVAAKADTTVVVVNPGWGDEIQAAKAGLLEIADVFVVNKADRQGAADTQADLERMLMLGPSTDAAAWLPPVVPTVATNCDGVAELWAAVEQHRAAMTASGELDRRRRHRRAEELRQAVRALLEARARDLAGDQRWAEIEAQVQAGTLDPRAAAAQLLGD
jgi:LAO/AO transport system kinase